MSNLEIETYGMAEDSKGDTMLFPIAILYAENRREFLTLDAIVEDKLDLRNLENTFLHVFNSIRRAIKLRREYPGAKEIEVSPETKVIVLRPEIHRKNIYWEEKLMLHQQNNHPEATLVKVITPVKSGKLEEAAIEGAKKYASLFSTYCKTFTLNDLTNSKFYIAKEEPLNSN